MVQSRVGAAAVASTVVVWPVGADLPRERSARPLAGVAVLAAALLLFVAGTTILDPGITGRAAAEPMPPPPAIGSCVVLSDDDVEVVPCDEPHSGEVVMTWSAGKEPYLKSDNLPPRMTFSVTRVLPEPGSALTCRGWVSDYIGWTKYLTENRGNLWFPVQPLVRGKFIGAPPSQRTPDLRWTACVVQTADQWYVGSLRNVVLRPGTPRPDEVSVCLSHGPSSVQFPSCKQAHQAELLGTVGLTMPMMIENSVTVSHTFEQLHEQCLDLARELTGAADPTYGGQLEIVTESIWQQRLAGVDLQPPSWLIPDCVARVVGERALVGSVVGNGDAPLPIHA